jgi:leucyl aminopeptidase
MLFDLKLTLIQDINSKNDESLFYHFLPSKIEDDKVQSIAAKYKLKNISAFRKKIKDNDDKKIRINLGESSSLTIIKYDENITNDFFRNECAGLVQNHDINSFKKIFISIELSETIENKFGSMDYLYQTIFEGLHLGNYSFNQYKEKKKLNKLGVFVEVEKLNSVKKILSKTEKIIEAVNFTKDLVNEPAVTLTPKELANRTRKKLSKLGINVSVWNKEQLKKNKMGAILAVGSASSNEPCMIVAHYKPKVKSKKKIALVGKGVTYDSGGLSIKPTAGMLQMNADMAGGAAAIGTIAAASLLNSDKEIFCIVPAVENMLSGNSFKPGDIIKSASGKTIEVKDTDAEGRLILADALHYASKLKPDVIIDFATLTGAVAVALGLYSAGLMSKNDDLVNDIIKSSEKTFEKVWRLPFGDEYNKLLESDVADLSNLGPRWGGSITAGKFLENFVDKKIPYAHLDIAGTALSNDLTNYTKKYHTGWGVRLMIDYLENS